MQKIYYCVEQYDKHHHEHRWIYEEDTFKKRFPYLTIFSDNTTNAYIYGGNACKVTKVSTRNECVKFLLATPKGVDIENPTIKEMNSYCLTVDGGFESITREIIMTEGLDGNLLIKYDPRLKTLMKMGVKETDFGTLAEANLCFNDICEIIKQGKYQELLTTLREYHNAPNYIPEYGER